MAADEPTKKKIVTPKDFPAGRPLRHFELDVGIEALRIYRAHKYFAMERFLYRLTQSPFADRFILKGALLLTAWRAPMSRPTIDIDLAGRTSNNELDHITELTDAFYPIQQGRFNGGYSFAAAGLLNSPAT
jgi:nucleotidyltransferase AbiEii toxin of type IV toxin-antitoxin system